MSLNPALELKEYITSNIGDSAGSWEYGHTPYIESILRKLNKAEAEEFSLKIWEWEHYHLYELADPIIWSGNKYIDEYYLYSKIFSLLNDSEQLVYLAQNLEACIKCVMIQGCEDKLLEDVRDNLYFVINNIKSESWIESYLELIDFINNELLKRKTKVIE